MIRLIIAVLFLLCSTAAFAQGLIVNNQLIRYFTDSKEVIIGKVTIQVSRPELKGNELLDHLRKSTENTRFVHEVIQKQGYNLVDGNKIDGLRTSSKPLCEIVVDGENIRYTRCNQMFPGQT